MVEADGHDTAREARVEAMLKLEIRKRIRIDEVKDVVLSEMWQEKAKLEPQEGLFANLEAKLHNILDAVGSIETVSTQNSRSSKAGVAAQKSKASSIGGAGAGSECKTRNDHSELRPQWLRHATCFAESTGRSWRRSCK